MKYLSLCIPTNGISEWVFPVLESIYSQNVNNDLFEVVVTDNGENEDFSKSIKEYSKEHENLIYKRTDAYMFYNQVEAFKLASGEYLKFINHRSVLQNGSIEWMLDVINNNYKDKPVIYFSNGAIKDTKILKSFDEFVYYLGRFASLSMGIGVWKSDFEKIPEDHVYNIIAPHSDILFSERQKEKYIIDNRTISHDIYSGHVNKGKYDLFKAFAIEIPSITLQLFLEHSISVETLKHVLTDYKKLVSGFYSQFVILKEPCSYDLSGFDSSMGVFMKKNQILPRAYAISVVETIKKIRGKKNNENSK